MKTLQYLIAALFALFALFALASCASDDSIPIAKPVKETPTLQWEGTPNPLDPPGGPADVAIDRYGETQGRFAPNWEQRRMVGLYGR